MLPDERPQARGRGREPGLRVTLLEAPSGQAQIDTVGRGQIGERERADLRFDGPDPLGERRLGDARGAHGARQHDTPPPAPAGRDASGDPRQDLLHQQAAHLARHAGQQHGDAAAPVLEPEPRCGAPRVGEHARPLGHLGLGAVDGGHGTAEPLEPRLDARQQPLVQHQPLAEQLRHDPLGHVVARGSEAAGGHDERGALERLGHRRADRVRPVGNRGAAGDLGARRRQGAPQLGGVAIDGMTEQQLRADGDDFELHPPPLSSAR